MVFESNETDRSKIIFNAVSGNGCLCRVDTQLSLELKQLLACGSSGVATMKCVEVLLCSFLDKLCMLHRRQIYSGDSCSAVKELIDILMGIQYNVEQFLVELLRKTDCYVKYAASKALASFLTISRLTTHTHARYSCIPTCMQLKLKIQECIPILTTIEHFYLVQSEKMPAASNFRAKEHCDTVSVKSPTESTIDDTWLSSISDGGYDLMSDIHQSDKKWHELENWECLTRILRILVIAATRYPDEGFLAHYHILLELLHSSSPILMANSSRVLHKNIKLVSKSAATCEYTAMRLQMITSNTLYALAKIPCKVSADHHDLLELRGFGGSLHLTERNLTWSYFEFQEEDGQFNQSVVLLYLSSLLFRIMYPTSTDDFQLRLRGSIDSFQTFCEKKLTFWNASHSLRYSLYLVMLFDDQDDALIEALDYSLEIASQLKRNSFEIGDLYCQTWNPHTDFFFLLCSIRMDHTVILDFLMSNDTVFLLYFVKYLKLAIIDKENVLLSLKRLSRSRSFIEESFEIYQSTRQKRCGKQFSFNPTPSLEQVINVCDLLRVSIGKQLDLGIFPYNARPLQNLLGHFASLYGETFVEKGSRLYKLIHWNES